MSALTGTPRLLRLALRRDRIVLPAWIAAVAALSTTVVVSVVGLYPTEAERVAAATFTAASPIARAFDGPASGTELGALVAVEATAVLSVLTALMAIQAVVRHTRRDEEAGLAELLGSAVVGRHARLATALLLALGASLLVGAAVTGVFLAQGLGTTGSVAVGAAIAGVGVTFAGVAAVTAQLVTTARGANGLAGAVLGAAFLLRAVGDAAGEVADSGVEAISAWPSWLSPIGWAQQVRPFGGDHLGLLALPAVTTVVLLAVAVALAVRRDLGAGILATRPGPATASRWLRSPLGLIWRLQRGTLLAWCAGIAVIGAAFGAVGDSVDDLLEISPELVEVLTAVGGGDSLVDLYLALAVSILAIVGSGVVVQLLLRARTEELSGRLEPVLATAVSRARWLLGHVALAALGAVTVMVVLGAAGAAGFAAVTGDGATGVGMLMGALANVPAAWALGSVVVAAVVTVPRWAPAIGWSLLAASLVIGQFGDLLGLPEAAVRLSPFHHVPALPADELAVAPLVVLTAIAVTVTAAAVTWFVRRDLVVTA